MSMMGANPSSATERVFGIRRIKCHYPVFCCGLEVLVHTDTETNRWLHNFWWLPAPLPWFVFWIDAQYMHILQFLSAVLLSACDLLRFHITVTAEVLYGHITDVFEEQYPYFFWITRSVCTCHAAILIQNLRWYEHWPGMLPKVLPLWGKTKGPASLHTALFCSNPVSLEEDTPLYPQIIALFACNLSPA